MPSRKRASRKSCRAVRCKSQNKICVRSHYRVINGKRKLIRAHCVKKR